jgi:hypothetical protein
MPNKLSSLVAEFTMLRVVAGAIFLPLMAIAFQPFQNMDLSFALRLIFWTGVTALALGVTWAARQLLKKWFAETPFTGWDLAFTFVAFALFVPSLWLMTLLVFSAGGQQAPDVLSVVSYGALFTTGLLIIRRAPVQSPTDHDINRFAPRLCRRLPQGFTGQILRLAVRDHCVDVVTTEGLFTIRSRFTDAIAEMEPERGHCTHRSHWVVDAAVTGIEKSHGKTFLRLTNGELVPVSRKYKPILEKDGVI